MTPSRFAFLKSVSTRFLLLCFAISLACTLPVLWFANRQAEEILLADFTGRLERRRGNLERHFQDGGTALLLEKIQDRIERRIIDDGLILLVDDRGRKLGGNLASWPAAVDDVEGWQPVQLRQDGERRARPYLASVTQLENGNRLLVSGLLDDREEVRLAMTHAILGAILLAMALATLGSLFIRSHLNRMVQVVARTASNIAAGNLSRRAPRNHSLDPLDQVSESLNRILARIEGLIEENRTMTDALAHDLRSPLTRICASLERAGLAAGDAKPADSLQAIEQEIALMLRMIDDTMEVSRAEAGIGREHFETFDLAAVLRGLFEMYLPLAHVNGVELELDCQSELWVHGNKGLITRALANLIDNAFKHGLAGGKVWLQARRGDGQVIVAVRDSGHGIPPDRYSEALAKYRRLSMARSLPGMGLGLTLVTAVAHLHNGSLKLDDNCPGLAASLLLPGAPPA
ncbi:HAMP domain-containing sensor histidine kinase [Novosphingobium sp.]|uniref:sensor histidine kinase n=1 Tax=Novosphingobium sp. TaxID=1874826 RepID=UPI002732ED8E|nr:HAMP domain-containing sensor histidine kinase [Novosphingobium sp.]MDP3908558.1 HAMP domain-containing sensor histidine kinase [Novosphingobium sp.]